MAKRLHSFCLVGHHLHRIALTPEVSISGQNVDQVIDSVLRSIEAPRG